MKIVIDAGHGPNTPGKRCPDDSMREYYFNAAVARYLIAALANYEGVQTKTSFQDSRDIPIDERVQIADSWPADVVVSIHANAKGSVWNDAKGIETLVDYRKPAGAVKLAQAIQKQLIDLTGLNDRGIKYRNDLGVLNNTDMSSVLVECGFMTNRVEAALLKSDDFRRICAKAIENGLVETYGLRRKTGAPPPIQPKEDYLMSPGDANKIIGFLSAAHGATPDVEAQAEFHRLANELRKASGQPVQ